MQLQPSLADQRGGAQGRARTKPEALPMGELAQLHVEQVDQLLESERVPGRRGACWRGADVHGHAPECSTDVRFRPLVLFLPQSHTPPTPGEARMPRNNTTARRMDRVLPPHSARRMALPIALALAAIAAGNTAAATDDSASADVLVFDASGSMWGQLQGGENKIVVAREVMAEFFQRRDAATPLAVIAYGHRRRGDCKDIEVIAASGKHDASQLASKLAGINPRGMTPIAESLRLAAAQVPRTAERSNIILVTDGLETCDADPCAVAAELAASGHGIRAHVVGFGLTEKEASALSCVTEQTGGLLLRPQSGAELAAALDQISEDEPAPEPVVAEAFFDIGPKAEASGKRLVEAPVSVLVQIERKNELRDEL